MKVRRRLLVTIRGLREENGDLEIERPWFRILNVKCSLRDEVAPRWNLAM